jgi:hypothetical protein
MRQAMHKDEPSNPYHRQERAAVPGEFGLHPPVLAAAVCAEGGGRGDDECFSQFLSNAKRFVGRWDDT